MFRLIFGAIIALISFISYLGTRETNKVTGKIQYVALTPEQEIAIGLKALPQLSYKYGGMEIDKKAEKIVDTIGNRIVEATNAKKTPYKFDFHVLNDDNTINAFALPGGQVFITSALLKKLKTEGQVAGVLGHEIGHVIARHGAEHLAKEKLTRGLAGAASIATYDPNHPNSRYAGAIAQAIGQLVNMRFGRKDELEADILGIKFMSETGYNPQAMIEVMKILDKATKSGRPPEFFSTHPNPQNRIGNIKQTITKYFPNGVPAELKE